MIKNEENVKFEDVVNKKLDEVKTTIDEINEKVEEQKKVEEEKKQQASHKNPNNSSNNISNEPPRYGSLTQCDSVKENFSRKDAQNKTFGYFGLEYDLFGYGEQTTLDLYNSVCTWETIMIYNQVRYKYYYSMWMERWLVKKKNHINQEFILML